MSEFKSELANELNDILDSLSPAQIAPIVVKLNKGDLLLLIDAAKKAKAERLYNWKVPVIEFADKKAAQAFLDWVKRAEHTPETSALSEKEHEVVHDVISILEKELKK